MTRHIQPEMQRFIESKLKENGIYQDALKRSDARMVFRLAAEACVGIREVGGNNCGPMVELIQRTLGGADRESWCMSLVQTLIAFAESVTGVVSPIMASEHCLTVWNSTLPEFRVASVPAPGAIAIWRHGSTTNGHTGVTIQPPDPMTRFVPMVEGNTESGISGGKVERDGGGCYYTRRSLNGTGDMRLVGFLKPFRSI